MTLSILSYNIHKGFASGGRKFTLHETRKALREIAPDLVILQEVQGEHRIRERRIRNWPELAHHEYLAHEVWPYVVYGKNCVYRHGHHGNAVLSRYPISATTCIDVSASRFENRGLLHVVIDSPLRVHVLCVHFGLLRRWRKRQLARLTGYVAEVAAAHEPVIVAGDFNDWSGAATKVLSAHLELDEVFGRTRGRHAASFPAFAPFLRLDRIYFRHLRLTEARALTARPWRSLSDHAPLLATFRVSNGEA